MGKFDGLKAKLGPLRELWNPPREVFLVRALVGLCGAGLVSLCLITGWFFSGAGHKDSHAPKGEQHAVEVEDQADEAVAQDEAHAEGAESEGHGEAKEGGHEGGGDNILAKQDPIPKSIRARQDHSGLAEGHDLMDPEINEVRGLASKFGEVKITQSHRFVEMREIAAITKQEGSFSSKVMVAPAVEVDTYEATQEVQERQIEFQALISALIGERRGDELKSQEGLGKLKADIMREMNHLMRKGRVTDVLFVNLFVL